MVVCCLKYFCFYYVEIRILFGFIRLGKILGRGRYLFRWGECIKLRVGVFEDGFGCNWRVRYSVF